MMVKYGKIPGLRSFKSFNAAFRHITDELVKFHDEHHKKFLASKKELLEKLKKGADK